MVLMQISGETGKIGKSVWQKNFGQIQVEPVKFEPKFLMLIA
jgi:hypothetical protein